MTTDPATILSIYNRVLTANGLAAKPMSKTPRKGGRKVVMRESLIEFGQWCVDNGVDPERWVRARHDAIGFRHRISIENLASPKFLPKFRDFGDDLQHEAQGQDRMAQAVVDDVPIDSDDLRFLSESLKRAYSMDPELCAMSQDLTGGWNPKSEWCRSCSAVGDCKAKMPEATRRRREGARAWS